MLSAMADNPIHDFIKLNFDEMSPDEIERTKAYLEGAREQLSGANEYAQAVGDLCASWAWLDRALDQLFEPILDCPTEQVACIRNENTDARCNMLSRLLHTNPNP